MSYEGLLSLCKIEMEYIEKEGVTDRDLLKIRMVTIFVNLRIVRRSGYSRSVDEKDQYLTLRAQFRSLQEEHQIFYDNDDL